MSLALVVIALLAATPSAGASGASLVRDINPGTQGSYPGALTDVNGTLYFDASAEIFPGIINLPDDALWRSDGTAAGTRLVRDIHSDVPDFLGPLAAVDSTLFFVADDGVHGRELWRSDGTAAGTRLVRDIRPGSLSRNGLPLNSNPDSLTNVAGTLFFTADDGVHGRELWRSDGTRAGTRLVRDIVPGNRGLYPIFLTSVGRTLFFSVAGSLWRSDGTAAGTKHVPGVSQTRDLTNVGGTLFFSGTDGSDGHRLWRSDGTAAGTRMVGGGFDPTNLTDVAGTVFFSASDPSHGRELWRSDGTTAGTRLVRDINPGSASSYPGGVGYSYPPGGHTNVGRTLFFGADDGTHGYELWRSDGTTAGTGLVRDINPGGAASAPNELTNVRGTLFFAATDATHGHRLWRSDGTAAGTRPVGGGGFDPANLTNVRGTLFFAATDATHGTELWKAVP